MDLFTLFAIVCLLGLALFAWRKLYYFNYTNGLMEYLYKTILSDRSPGGQPLQILLPTSISTSIVGQFKGPCLFQLLFFEDWSHPDTTWAGVYFIGSFGASFALVVVESLRHYNLTSPLSPLGAWTTLPGILMFNHTPAIMLPLYLALRLILFTPPTLTTPDLIIDPTHLEILPWAFTLGYLLPFLLLLLPDIPLGRARLKQTVAAWWQQWPLYISLCHFTLQLLWPPSRADPVQDLHLDLQAPVYHFILAVAALSHWAPILAALGLHPGLTLRSLFLPSAPDPAVRAASGYQAAKWTVQWDVWMDSPALLLWAAALFWQQAQRGVVMWGAVVTRVLGLGLLAGPVGAGVGLLWERDRMVLGMG
jgi:hypothetical protein